FVLHRFNTTILLLHSRFFFHDPPPTEIYTLSLHDALPISLRRSSDCTSVNSSPTLSNAPSSKSCPKTKPIYTKILSSPGKTPALTSATYFCIAPGISRASNKKFLENFGGCSEIGRAHV